MKIKKFALIFLFLSLIAFAKAPPEEEISEHINYWILVFYCILIFIAAAVAAIIIALSGIKFISTEDFYERKEVKKRIAYAIIALIFILISCPLVNFLIEGFDVKEFKCNCLSVITPTTTIPKPTTTTTIKETTTTSTIIIGTTTTTTTIAIPLKNILIYVTGDYNYCSGTKSNLETEGYEVELKLRSNSDELLNMDLSKYGQIWLLDACERTIPLTNNEIDEILNFRENKRGGLLLSVDQENPNCQSGVDPVANKLGVDFYGVFGTPDYCINPSFSHSVWDGVTVVSSSKNDAYMKIDNLNVKVTAKFLNENYGAVLDESGKGRVVFDTSLSRFCYSSCSSAQDFAYQINIAKWLNREI